MIGNILALTNSASASNENIEVDGLLKKGLYNGTASDLKEDIDKKVSQEAGKGLSSNDYTDDEKQKNEENANKRIVGFTVTGDVNKIITITFADSTVMQAPFNDNDHIPLADVNMNSLNFNENTGVLTGVKSDGNEISVSLDGRYSLIGHNHDEQYSPKTHTHSEYAPSSHRHNLGDIDGMPNDLATTENVNEAIKNLRIGGRNLVRDTGNFKLLELPYYLQANYVGNAGIVSETFRGNNVMKLIYNWQGFQCKTTFEDRPMVISFWAKTTKQNIKFIGVSDNSVEFVNGNALISDGKWHKYVVRKNNRIITSNNSNKGFIEFYCADYSKHIEEVYVSSFKFEYGNISTDWSPAPEDFGNPVYYQNITNAHTFLNRISSVHIGSGGNIVNAPSTHYYEMVGFTHSNLNWGFIIAKNIDVDDKSLYVKQLISGSYKDWFKIKENDPVGNIINGTRQILPNEADKVIFITNSIDNCALNVFPDKCSVSFRKVFDGGHVNFTCLDRNIIYTGDNQFNGKKGSTAVVSIYGSDCYIDIRNV